MLRDAITHTEQVWSHVTHGNSTLSEKLEFGSEVAIGAAAAYTVGRFIPARCMTEAQKLVKKLLPNLEISSAERAVGHDFAQPSFIDPETQARIPGGSDTAESMPFSRLSSGFMPKGDFTPNESEWREMTANGRWGRDYQRKVVRGESPTMDEAAPPRVKALREIAKAGKPELGPDEKTVWMTSRGLEGYKQRLRIPDSELDTPGRLVLDLGSGAQQELAKDARKLGLRSTIASVDPGLAQPLADDLARVSAQTGKFRPNKDDFFLTTQEYRYLGRLQPERFTAAHEADLPFKQYDSVYAQYSLPYYSKTDEIGAAFDRINGLIKPGGNARIYPIRPSQIEPIQEWFSSHGMKPVFEHQPESGARRLFDDPDLANFRLLTWTK